MVNVLPSNPLESSVCSFGLTTKFCHTEKPVCLSNSYKKHLFIFFSPQIIYFKKQIQFCHLVHPSARPHLSFSFKVCRFKCILNIIRIDGIWHLTVPDVYHHSQHDVCLLLRGGKVGFLHIIKTFGILSVRFFQEFTYLSFW